MTNNELTELRESVWRIMGWTPWTEEEYPYRQGWSLLDGEGEKHLECDMDDPTTDPASSDALDDAILKKLSCDNEPVQIVQLKGRSEFFMSAVFEGKSITARAADKKICRVLFAKKLFAKD